MNTSPQWSPQGDTIAFVSSLSGSNQIWLLPRSGGEATQLTKCNRPVNLIAWSPCGSKLLVSCKCKPSDFQADSRETSDVEPNRMISR